MNSSAKKVAKFWGESYKGKEHDIYNFDPTRKYFCKLVTGKKEADCKEDWLEDWFFREYLSQSGRLESCLSVCCGTGERDRRINNLGYFKNCVSIDLSDFAIDSAKRAAAGAGMANIAYIQGDLNSLVLGENKYDLVYVAAGMHHIENLEHLVNQIHLCLKPGGYLFCDEYVGPNRTNLSPRHREIINSVIHLIPERLKATNEDNFIPGVFKKSHLLSGLLLLSRIGRLELDSHQHLENSGRLRSFGFRSLRFLNSIFRGSNRRKGFRYGKVFDVYPEVIKYRDPSEGVRSEEIIGVIKGKFRQTECHYYNGSILAFALDERFLRNYDGENPADVAILDMIIKMEMDFIKSGEIPSIHAAIVSRKT